MRRSYLFYSLTIALYTMVSPNAQAQNNEAFYKRLATISTMSEAALASASIIRNKIDEPMNKFYWSSNFDEETWNMKAEGFIGNQAIKITLAGYLWEYNNTWNISYFGNGNVDDEPILVYGKADWIYNDKLDDRDTMDFHQVIKFGENSSWNWIVGSEVVLGGATAGASAFVLATGAGPLAFIVGLNAAVGGANIAVTLSKTIRDSIESDVPTPPPAAPERPSLNENSIAPGNSIIAVAVDNASREVSGFGPETNVQLHGTFDIEKQTYDGYLEFQ